MKKKFFSITCVIFAILFIVAGCAKQKKDISSAEDLNQSGMKVAVVQGTAAMYLAEENFSNAQIKYYPTIADAGAALSSGQIDGFVYTRHVLEYYEESCEDIVILNDNVGTTPVSVAMKKDNTELKEKIDAYIEKVKADGTLADMKKRWDEVAVMPEIEKPENPQGTLRIATEGMSAPFTYFGDNGELMGIDIEFGTRLAYDLNMDVSFTAMSFDGLFPALETGKVDIVLNELNATQERSEVVLFSEPYFISDIVVAVKKDQNIDDTMNQSFIDQIKASFRRTFIVENRWKLILSGLGVTVLISLCAFAIGSLWGSVVCAGLRSGRRIANASAKIYVRLLQGTPIVVLLMILYYIVFKDFDLSAVIVAIIGFALNFGAYAAEIFRTAIESVDKGQIEAAFALGFSKIRVFTKIIFPQAARNALPVYKGEFISLVKSTSIVGYIAIQDLTKASDIIRSRTYEAFFPLVTTAVIYFVVTYLFIVLLNAIEKKIDPKRRKRTIKGVERKNLS